MGWSSGTSIFDAAVDVALGFILEDTSLDAAVTAAVVKDMYTKVDWDDWDTQDESKYFQPYLLEVMHDLGEIDEETYEDLTAYGY